LLQFVVEQGVGGDRAFAESAVRALETYVHSRARRLQESNLCAVCAIPSPRLRLMIHQVRGRLPTGGSAGWLD
ncbi:MAG: hypothetical protein ACKPKO_30055, partial [Candidatus Fonsibacter sp.]